VTGSKIDTLLSDFSLKYHNEGLVLAKQFGRDLGILDDSNYLHFGLLLRDSNSLAVVRDKLTALGCQIFEQDHTQLGVAFSLDDFDKLQKQAGSPDFWHQLADLSEIRDLKVLQKPNFHLPLTSDTLPIDFNPTNILSSTTSDPNQGVTTTGAAIWQQSGFRGQGVKIGIIDGGFKGYQNFLGSALPNQVGFKSFLFGNASEGSDEHGVAVAEVVHSLAPDAQLILTPISDEIGFANAVDYLLGQHVKIIQASLGWGGLWPGDGTGTMDSKLDEARQQGVLPIISAGNYGQSHYMGYLKPDASGYNQFENNTQFLKLTAEADSAWVALRWDESWSAPQTNLDLYVLDNAKQVVGSSRNIQGGGSQKPPSELVPFTTTPGQTYYIQVRLTGKAASQSLHFHLFAYNASVESSTAEQSLATPADARGALSVGATYWKDDSVENYSSRGPTQDGRLKPELMAPTRIDSLVYGRYNQSFGGTSAAAPQVSGVAAVVWSAVPNLNADQVARYLERNAQPLTGGGRQPTTGYGRLKLGSPQLVQAGNTALLGPLATGPAFNDDFHDHQSGLPDDILAYYGTSPTNNKPAYFMQASKDDTLAWSVYATHVFTEFRADFEVVPPPNNQLFYGLVFWQQAADRYYVLLVNSNEYALLQRDGTVWRPLINWQSETTLQLNNGTQRIGVEATTTYIKILVGDSLLQTVSLNPSGVATIGGKLGFASGTFSKNNTTNATERPTVGFNSLTVIPLAS
jgi:subtilisin family serine protease